MDRTLLQDMEVFTDGLPAEDVQSHMFQLVHAVAFLHKNKVGLIIWAAATSSTSSTQACKICLLTSTVGKQCRPHCCLLGGEMYDIAQKPRQLDV